MGELGERFYPKRLPVGCRWVSRSFPLAGSYFHTLRCIDCILRLLYVLGLILFKDSNESESSSVHLLTKRPLSMNQRLVCLHELRSLSHHLRDCFGGLSLQFCSASLIVVPAIV